MNELQDPASFRSREALPRSQRASVRKWAKVLATFPLFGSVRKRRLRKLVREATFAELAPGERFVVDEHSDISLYIVLDGAAEAHGGPTSRTLGAGDYFGELAVIDGAPRPATVIATQELHLMKLSRRTVEGLAARYARVSLAMFENLTGQLCRLEGQAAA